MVNIWHTADDVSVSQLPKFVVLVQKQDKEYMCTSRAAGFGAKGSDLLCGLLFTTQKKSTAVVRRMDHCLSVALFHSVLLSGNEVNTQNPLHQRNKST